MYRKIHCDQYPYWFMEGLNETIKDSPEHSHEWDSPEQPRKEFRKWIEHMIDRCPQDSLT